MTRLKVKSALSVIAFVFLLLLATNIGTLYRRLPIEYAFFYSMTYVLSIGIYIGLFAAWTISVYNRIMQSHVRTYLMLIGVNIFFWVSVRTVKWLAFRPVAFGDRMAWYMYYIPMVMIPLLFFFTALCVGEDEHYRPNKRWNLLFIPAVLLIALVLTNDLHMLVFSDFDITIHPYGQKYRYGVGYYAVMAFIVALAVSSVFLIVKKFSRSSVSRRASRLPLFVVFCIALYILIYMADSSYGIGYYFMDATIFGCFAAVAFWEACIRTGLVHSNSSHKDFFKMATIRAQILNVDGEVAFASESALPLSDDTFETLKQTGSTDYDKSTLVHMSPIEGGYVSWSSDVSGIKSVIAELLELNKKLYEEVDLLQLENRQKKENTRAKTLTELHSVLLSETLPYSERIKSTVMANENASIEEMKQLLFETSVISTYLKRKVNLILIAQTEKSISTDEMNRAFLEVFGLLKFHGKNCILNILENFQMSLSTALLCYDLFQRVMERLAYQFETLYVTLNEDEGETIFTITAQSDGEIDFSELLHFEKQKMAALKGKIKVVDEPESCYISISIPKEK